jgi:hypothetical protein
MPWWGWALAVVAVPVLGLISLACLLPSSPPIVGPGFGPPPSYRPPDRSWGCGCVTGLAAILIFLGLLYSAWHALVH